MLLVQLVKKAGLAVEVLLQNTPEYYVRYAAPSPAELLEEWSRSLATGAEACRRHINLARSLGQPFWQVRPPSDDGGGSVCSDGDLGAREEELELLGPLRILPRQDVKQQRVAFRSFHVNEADGCEGAVRECHHGVRLGP